VKDDLDRGLQLMREGAYFEAHEALEDAWRASDPAEKDFFQGLDHVTVAWYQAGRGNWVGCERQLAKAERRLGPFAPTHREVDLSAVLGQVRAAAAIVEGGSLDLPPLRLGRSPVDGS
jgi:predicted metal-dependent hydrolase